MFLLGATLGVVSKLRRKADDTDFGQYESETTMYELPSISCEYNLTEVVSRFSSVSLVVAVGDVTRSWFFVS